MSPDIPSIDFSDIPTMEPIPAGNYHAEIVFAEVGLSKKQNLKIDLRWKIVGGAFDGRNVFDSLSFHPNALFRVKAVLSALGWKKNFKGTIEAEDLIGREADIRVSIDVSTDIDEDTGEPYPPRNRVKAVHASE